MRWMWRYKFWLSIVSDQSVGIVDAHYYDRKGNDLVKE